MAIIKYERGKDGVTRESVSNDGGKSFSSTGANSSNGYSGSAYKPPSSNSGSSSSSKKPASTSSNKNTGNSGGSNYSDYNQSQYDNQKAYLESLIKQGGGNASWAQNELNNLNSQYGGNKNSGGNGYFMPTNPDGSGVHYNNTDVGTWDTSGQKWTNVGGTDDVNYAISGDNGTIIVTDSNGVQTRFLPTSADYNSFYQNMLADIQNAGNRYTPHYTFGVDQDLDGEKEYYDTKAYTWGNPNLQYALQQAAKENPGLSVEDYVLSMYNRIGTTRNDGTVVTLDDVNKELGRLGLSDYNSQNAVLTAGQNLLPGNEFLTIGPDKTGDEGTWGFYGGQQYRVGGDQADFVNYVNGKTGNLNNNLSYIFGDMANNPYAQQDPGFMQQYLQGQSQFNSGAYPSAGNGAITGNQNVDNVINYWNSMNNYGNVSGNSGSVGTSSLLELLQGYLDSGLEANKGFLEQQKALAQQNAEKAASDAYVNQMLQQDAVRQQMSALGLGTSGALQSAQMGIQGNYGNNLSEIQSNLNTMLNGLSEQELQILTDYYNNMANYAYDVTKYEQDRAMQNAQLALQQQQAQYDRQYQQQQLALQQQQWEWQQRQAAQQNANSQYQYYNDTQNSQKESQADRYENLHNAGVISGSQLMNALNGLGALGGNNANVSNTGIYNGYTAAQYNNQAAYLQNMIMNGTPGQKVWAQNELAKLNAQYGR